MLARLAQLGLRYGCRHGRRVLLAVTDDHDRGNRPHASSHLPPLTSEDAPTNHDLQLPCLMQEMASTQGKISEMLGNLNMAKRTFSGCTSTTAPEIALTGQEPMVIGLLVSALDGLAGRGYLVPLAAVQVEPVAVGLSGSAVADVDAQRMPVIGSLTRPIRASEHGCRLYSSAYSPARRRAACRWDGPLIRPPLRVGSCLRGGVGALGERRRL